MKVICIDAAPRYYTHNEDLLKEGEPYNIDREVIAIGTDGVNRISYKLVEFPPPHAFCKDRFIPCSEIDETELIKERELVNA